MLKCSQKTKNLFHIIKAFISIFLTALVVILACTMICVKLFDWNLLSVNSASMSPQYPVDTLLIVQPVDASEIEKGDVISYRFNNDGLIVTHRVVSVDKQNKTFTTKGDANNTADPMSVHWESLVGKVIIGIPKLGKPMRFLTVQDNRFIVISVIIGIFVISLGLDIIGKRRNKENEK